MILSPYHNPPYRTPTSKGSSTPLPSSSPKRKRNDQTESHSDTTATEVGIQADEDFVSGQNSPRSKVAERFKDLNIQPVRPRSLQTNDPVKRRKRLKRNPAVAEYSHSSNEFILGTAGSKPTAGKEDLNTGEVGETPGSRSHERATPSLEPSEDLQEESDDLSEEESIFVSAWQRRPPSPQVLISSPPSSDPIVDRSVSPLPQPEELTSDQVALTWQEHEITGHELDPSGDDDGDGINGIGFRPTPAIAVARQQRRKQQVNEWRAREAREARQERFERRKREAIVGSTHQGQGTAEPGERRIVRFAGVG